MSRGRHEWQAGRAAYDRLADWRHAVPASASPGDGENALDALTDVGTVRRQLEQAELNAVRTARRHGRSWAEIATRLGVTRQSAWERWRDLDEDAELDTDQVPAVAARALTRAAMSSRRRSTVVVPDVVGMSVSDALKVLRAVGLEAVGADPDGPPLSLMTSSTSSATDSVVADQSPEPGATVPPGTQVTLWLGRGGGSGVREPRRPPPAPRTGMAMVDEETGEAVG